MKPAQKHVELSRLLSKFSTEVGMSPQEVMDLQTLYWDGEMSSSYWASEAQWQMFVVFMRQYDKLIME
jgi:hypothetical protein